MHVIHRSFLDPIQENKKRQEQENLFRHIYYKCSHYKVNIVRNISSTQRTQRDRSWIEFILLQSASIPTIVKDSFLWILVPQETWNKHEHEINMKQTTLL